jgi:dTDP-4-dehydrorhamnose reductase
MKLLVTGSTGLLGGRLVPFLRNAGWDVVAHGNSHSADIQANLLDPSSALTMLDEVSPECVINLVCLSDVDSCETDPDLAYRLNALSLINLVPWLLQHPKTRLIQISTDQIYNGPGNHLEQDVKISNMYGITKLAAEQAALRVNGLVLRTNFFGRSDTPAKKSFSDWLIESLKAATPIVLFTDVMFSPLAMETLSSMIARTIDSAITGIFNLGSNAGLSKRDFAMVLAERIGTETENAKDGKVSDLHLKAVRPTGMLMDCSKFEKTFGVTLPTLKEEIERAEI